MVRWEVKEYRHFQRRAGIRPPAIDLSSAVSLLPSEARHAFWEAYGPVDPELRARARYLAVGQYGILLLAHAIECGDTPLIEEARRTLGHALEEG